MVAGERLASGDVDRVIPRAILDPDDEARRRPRRSAIGRADDQVLVVEALAGLPERLVLLVLKRHEDRAVRLHRGNRELVLVALAGRSRDLESAKGRVEPRDLL